MTPAEYKDLPEGRTPSWDGGSNRFVENLVRWHFGQITGFPRQGQSCPGCGQRAKGRKSLAGCQKSPPGTRSFDNALYGRTLIV
jgi:hypothetical protein